MNLIYDRERAIARKKEIDRETEEENERRKKENKKIKWIGIGVGAAIITLIAGITVCLCLFLIDKNFIPLCIGLGAVLSLLAILAVGLYINDALWLKTEADYPADVEFLNKTDGYNILQIHIEKAENLCHKIKVDREDKSHKVETVFVAFLKDMTYANLPESSKPVIDLEAGEYKIPYVRKRKENENYL